MKTILDVHPRRDPKQISFPPHLSIPSLFHITIHHNLSLSLLQLLLLDIAYIVVTINNIIILNI